MAEYTLIPTASLKAVLELEGTRKACARELALAESGGDDITKALITGAAMNKLRSLMTDQVMADVMQLVGSPIGISCETGKQYPKDIVRDVVLQGMLSGARVVGGEIHIASGKLYLTKNYWERRLKELPDVTDVRPPTLGLPREQKLGDKTYATVQAKLEYRYRGVKQTLDRTGDNAITVIWNAGMGLDAIHGKCKKRLYQIAVGFVTGANVQDEDEATVETPAGFHDTLHTEPQAPYSVGDEIAADAAHEIGEQTPFDPAAEQDAWKQRILDAGTIQDANELAREATDLGFQIGDALQSRISKLTAGPKRGQRANGTVFDKGHPTP